MREANGRGNPRRAHTCTAPARMSLARERLKDGPTVSRANGLK